jgi:hypothetical protein
MRFGGEVGRRPAPPGELFPQGITFLLCALQAPKAPILYTPFFAATDEPVSAERLSALVNMAAEARAKSGLANRTTSLALEGLASRSRSRPLATY